MMDMEAHCPDCESLNVVKYGRQPNGKQRYRCENDQCDRRIFVLSRGERREMPDILRRAIDIALNGANVEDASRRLDLPRDTVMAVFQLLAKFKAAPPKPQRLMAKSDDIERIRAKTG